jgi:hypothetical protein
MHTCGVDDVTGSRMARGRRHRGPREDDGVAGSGRMMAS